MSDKTQISVIIPNYNNAKYLPACLDSVLAQTFKDFECLVVDDCSTDESRKTISGYAKRDPRVRLVEMPKNSGVGAARNKGLDEARGEFVFFLDSDDVMSAAGLENLHRIALSLPSDLVSGQFSKVPDAFRIPGDMSPMVNFSFEYFDECQQFAGSLEGINLVVVWGKLFRRSILDGIRFRTDIYPYEDVEFMLRVYPRVKGGAVAHPLVLYYRQSDTSVISDKDRDVSGDVIKSMASLTAFMANRGDEVPLRYVLFLKKYCYEFTRSFIIRTNVRRMNRKKTDRSKRKALKIQLLNVSEFIRQAYRANLFADLDIRRREKIGLRLFGLGFIGLGAKLLERMYDTR
jgi:glycosyltransferase involved in cell wall biosynthesis